NMVLHKNRFNALASKPALVLAAIVWLVACPPRLTADEPAQPDAKDDKLKQLLKERLEVVRDLATKALEAYKNVPRTSYDHLRQAARMLLEAELDMCASDKERVAVLEKLVVQARKHEDEAKARFKAGLDVADVPLMAKADRLQVE